MVAGPLAMEYCLSTLRPTLGPVGHLTRSHDGGHTGQHEVSAALAVLTVACEELCSALCQQSPSVIVAD